MHTQTQPATQQVVSSTGGGYGVPVPPASPPRAQSLAEEPLFWELPDEGGSARRAAREVLERALTQEEEWAVEEAHEYGVPDAKGVYRAADPLGKVRILSGAGFDDEERRVLVMAGVVGKVPQPSTEQMRVEWKQSEAYILALHRIITQETQYETMTDGSWRAFCNEMARAFRTLLDRIATLEEMAREQDKLKEVQKAQNMRKQIDMLLRFIDVQIQNAASARVAQGLSKLETSPDLVQLGKEVE